MSRSLCESRIISARCALSASRYAVRRELRTSDARSPTECREKLAIYEAFSHGAMPIRIPSRCSSGPKLQVRTIRWTFTYVHMHIYTHMNCFTTAVLEILTEKKKASMSSEPETADMGESSASHFRHVAAISINSSAAMGLTMHAHAH